MQDWVTHVQSLHRQVTARSAELDSAGGDMNRLEESVMVALRQLTDAQSALLTVEGEIDEY